MNWPRYRHFYKCCWRYEGFNQFSYWGTWYVVLSLFFFFLFSFIWNSCVSYDQHWQTVIQPSIQFNMLLFDSCTCIFACYCLESMFFINLYNTDLEIWPSMWIKFRIIYCVWDTCYRNKCKEYICRHPMPQLSPATFQLYMYLYAGDEISHVTQLMKLWSSSVSQKCAYFSVISV